MKYENPCYFYEKKHEEHSDTSGDNSSGVEVKEADHRVCYLLIIKYVLPDFI